MSKHNCACQPCTKALKELLSKIILAGRSVTAVQNKTMLSANGSIGIFAIDRPPSVVFVSVMRSR